MVLWVFWANYLKLNIASYTFMDIPPRCIQMLVRGQKAAEKHAEAGRVEAGRVHLRVVLDWAEEKVERGEPWGHALRDLCVAAIDEYEGRYGGGPSSTASFPPGQP